MREHRLYQADWLLRFYEFKVGEITDAHRPNLDLEIDPKLAWALRHREHFPVKLNKAARALLLRVPGLGVRNADRILQTRRWHSIRLTDLLCLKISLKKIMPFIETADHTPKKVGPVNHNLRALLAPPAMQLNLFGAQTSAFIGQL
jgi:predicted DNA-binding helix-hairpin-helix protein